MNISKITYAMVMVLMMLVMFPSCKDDDDNVKKNGGESTDPEVVDPNNYKPQNEGALQKAAIANRIKMGGEYYSEMMNHVRSVQFSEFAAKMTKFSNKVSVAIGANPEGNTAVSPLSVFMALAMAAESAAGDTRQEILDAMGITYDELNANIQYVCYVCNQSLDRGMSNSNGMNVIRSVNSLWVQDGVTVKDDGVKALTDKYFTDLFKMDFVNTDVNDLVKSYISNETRGLLSPDLGITPETYLLLMNVVYLREIWDEDGNELRLTDNKYNFINYDQSPVYKQLMQGYYINGKAVITEKFRKFKTTTNAGLAITFFVPQDGYTLDDIYTTEVLDDATPYADVDTTSDPEVNYRFHTRCIFPDFSANYDADLKDVIKSLGVNKFFERYVCDFSNLTDEKVYCDRVRHLTTLDVARKGIEGAAVTVAFMEGCTDNNSLEKKIWKDVYYDFLVDRSFAYIVTKDYIPVFTGVVKTIK